MDEAAVAPDTEGAPFSLVDFPGAKQSATRARLAVPLEDPGAVYHPQQVERRHDKESGEWVFLRAHGTTENLARLVRQYQVRVRYNELSRDIEVSVDDKLRDGELARNTNLALIEDLCRINSYPHTQVAGNISSLAERDSYNPALEWIRSSPWDGTTRIGELFDCMELVDPKRYQVSWALFRKWMLGAAAILSGHATKFEHVLVLVDPNGGIGKTRFFNTLCPAPFQADGVALNVNDKDSVLNVISKWLVELGEIGATFSRSDAEALKAFLSRAFDEVRPAYARASNRYPRRTAFFGSVNNVRFLVDDTNNRRFWPIEVKAINYRHDINMQQVWAEALHQVEHWQEPYFLSPDENRMIGEHNESFRSMDRVEECVLTMYDSGGTPCRYLSASQVLDELGIRGGTGEMRRAGVILRKLFQHKKRNNVVVYHMPNPVTQPRPLSAIRNFYEDGPL